METLEKIALTIIETIGIAPIMRLIAARSPQEVAQAALDAAYNTERALSDAEAHKEMP